MSDDPVMADVSADAAQGADADSTPVPWGDDFNPEKAWRTITHLRGREKELETEAKAWKRFREDEEYRRQQLGELGYEFDEEDLEDEDDFEDPEPAAIPKQLQKELDDLKSWRSQQEQREARQAFDSHLDRLAAQSEVELSAFEKRSVLAASIENGFTPDATEQAFKDLVEWRSGFEKQVIDRYGKSKQAPNTPPQPGKAGEQSVDLTDRKARRAHFAAIAETQKQ